MSWAELGDKFRDCAGLVLADKDAKTAIQLVARIEELKSLSPLFRALTGGQVKAAKQSKTAKRGSKKRRNETPRRKRP